MGAIRTVCCPTGCPCPSRRWPDSLTVAPGNNWKLMVVSDATETAGCVAWMRPSAGGGVATTLYVPAGTPGTMYTPFWLLVQPPTGQVPIWVWSDVRITETTAPWTGFEN